MARYEHLPIYKASLEMTIYFEKIVRNFSRYNKYTLGSDLRNKSREISCQIMKANSLTNKKEALKEIVAMVEELKLLIRLCKETKVFYNFNSYYHSSKLITNIGKQAQAWLNHTH